MQKIHSLYDRIYTDSRLLRRYTSRMASGERRRIEGAFYTDYDGVHRYTNTQDTDAIQIHMRTCTYRYAAHSYRHICTDVSMFVPT